jgi:hypothetical protein
LAARLCVSTIHGTIRGLTTLGSYNYLFIVGVTPIGVATQQALGFNAGEIGGPLGTRHDSIVVGHYSPRWLISSMG